MWIKGTVVVPGQLCVCTHFSFQSPCFCLGGTGTEQPCQAGLWGHQSLRDTHVKHRQCPALSPGNAAGSMTRLRAKGWMGEPKIMYVSAVCQGRMPWVWEKLGCFASLTLEQGDELIKPLRNWSSVILHWTNVGTFLISWSLKLSGAGEHIWNAAQRHNFWVLHVEHPKPSLSMVSSCCPTPRCACQMWLWGAFPAQNRGILGYIWISSCEQVTIWSP